MAPRARLRRRGRAEGGGAATGPPLSACSGAPFSLEDGRDELLVFGAHLSQRKRREVVLVLKIVRSKTASGREKRKGSSDRERLLLHVR